MVMVAQREIRLGAGIILALSALAWTFVVWSTTNMDAPLVRLMMPMTAAWTAAEFLSVWTMWAVMMGAMMLPSAAPMLLTHRRMVFRRGGAAENLVFGLAYLLVWAGFSAAAAGLQWWLQSVAVLSHMLVLKGTWISGGVLVLAGLIQWTPFKQNCLARCRTPIGFLTTEWRPGSLGALNMGLRHGTYCLGCCWALMALLFVFGVMNLLAITALATLVAAEKLLPRGEIVSKLGGVVFVGWGLLLMAA